MAITAKEIAKQLGISRQAVYSVLSNKEVCHVSPDKREKILFLARAYHYRPNTAALQLNGKQTHRIGVVVDSYHGINSVLLTRLAFRLAADNYQLHAVTFTGLQQGLDAIAGLVNSGVDGIIYHKRYVPAEHDEIGIPAVAIADELMNDYFTGAKDAVKHLIEVHGHRKILYLSVEGPNPKFTVGKYKGYCEGMRLAGLDPLPQFHTLENTGFEKQLNKYLKSGVTAVFCTGVSAASHLIYQFRLRGIRVPEDVAVVGFFSGMSYPGIATVMTDQNLLAERAAEMILEKIRNGERTRRTEAEWIAPWFQPDLSCGCPGRLVSNFAFHYSLDGTESYEPQPGEKTL